VVGNVIPNLPAGTTGAIEVSGIAASPGALGAGGTGEIAPASAVGFSETTGWNPAKIKDACASAVFPP
jgi:hypothetical protein